MIDILIKNGWIVDGTGKPGFPGEVGVAAGRIALVAERIDADAHTVIDAGGLVVAPGFIDCHTHSDKNVFLGSDGSKYLGQGVTTQIVGQCGSSPAPYSEGRLDDLKDCGTPEEFAEWVAQDASPASFLRAADAASLGTNMAFFIGHGAVRSKVMGCTDARPTPEQLRQMQQILREAMEAGCLGYSSGLVYAPSVYADTDELTELARTVAEYGGIYASHIRGEGSGVLRAVREAIAIGRDAGATAWISHLKVIGRANEGMSERLLREIDEANGNGQRVFADQYPYTASSAPLLSQIPPRFLTRGKADFLARCADPALRAEIADAISHETEAFESSLYTAGYENCLVVGAEKTPELQNQTLAAIAAKQGCSPLDALCDLLRRNNGNAQGIYFNQCASDLMRIMAHPRVFCGSDWSDERHPVDEMQVGNGHPRGTGTMVRRLELVRDFNLRTLEESVHNLTLAPARALGLAHIGCLAPGWNADITVLDYENLHAPATYAHPHRKNTGIVHVLVNGQLAVRDGVLTGKRAGRALKRSAG